MKKLVTLFIFIWFGFTSFAYAQDKASITVELLSYEEKTNVVDDSIYCAISYQVVNESWGTLYGLRIETEGFDDRETKLDDYGMAGNVINPFGGWFNTQESLAKGDLMQSSNLEYKGTCKYIGVINAIKVAPKDCNIRMMPEEASCFDILDLKSRIDHITLKKR